MYYVVYRITPTFICIKKTLTATTGLILLWWRFDKKRQRMSVWLFYVYQHKVPELTWTPTNCLYLEWASCLGTAKGLSKIRLTSFSLELRCNSIKRSRSYRVASILSVNYASRQQRWVRKREIHQVLAGTWELVTTLPVMVWKRTTWFFKITPLYTNGGCACLVSGGGTKCNTCLVLEVSFIRATGVAHRKRNILVG